LNEQNKKSGATIRRHTPQKRAVMFKRKFLGFKITLFLILSITILVVLGLSSLFNITKFEVTGLKHYDKNKIIVATGIAIGSNGFKSIGNNVGDLVTLSYRNAEKQIADKFPYIKSATVVFSLPNKVKINIIERKPLFLIDNNGKDLVVDNEAYVLQYGKDGLKGSYTRLKGIKFDDFITGKTLKMINPSNFDYAKKVITAFVDSDKGSALKLLKSIKQINVADLSKVSILINSGLNVNLGNLNDLDYKVSFFKEIYSRSLKSDDKGYLDMTLKEPVLTPG